MQKKKKPVPKPPADPTLHLADEVSRVAKALEKQNRLRNRLMLGIVFGVGTAIGASIIASLIIIMYSKALSTIGIRPIVDPDVLRAEVERQLESQNPQE
jgi:hypothetical protein